MRSNFLFACCMLASFTVFAQVGTDVASIDKAYDYYDSKNFTEALKWFEKAAAEGNQTALLEIGDLYFFGLGVDVNYKKAMEYYNKSSIKDDPDVYYNMAEIFAAGLDGSQPNAKKAEEYFDKAVQGKSADAVILRNKEEKAKKETASIMKQALDFIYNKNFSSAIPLLEEAADKGNTEAMYKLATYLKGDETLINETYYWSNLCFPYMRANCIEIYNSLWDEYADQFKRDFSGDIFSPVDVAISIADEYYKNYEDDIALKWYLRAGDLGHIDGYYMVGMIYGFSEFMPLNYEKAKYYLQKAVEVGNEEAQIALDDLEY